MSKKHWIAGSGFIGCLYDNCEVFSTKRDAIDYLADLFNDDLYPKGVKSSLQKYEIYYFPMVDLWSGNTGIGADYCEIISCECDDISAHSDSGL